jgi:ElaB/YqjD/DUF883 family membrane-anchored ribosome-binding protein
MSEDKGKSARQWIDEAEEALARTGDALRSAWSETKETRMSTLKSAREAAARLGRAIDEGIDAARQSWDSSQQQGPDDMTSSEVESTAFDEEE